MKEALMNSIQPAARVQQQQAHRILVVEDEESLALGVCDALEHAGFKVEVAH